MNTQMLNRGVVLPKALLPIRKRSTRFIVRAEVRERRLRCGQLMACAVAAAHFSHKSDMNASIIRFAFSVKHCSKLSMSLALSGSLDLSKLGGLQDKNVIDQAEEAFQKQAKQVENTVQKPLAGGQSATSPDNSW